MTTSLKYSFPGPYVFGVAFIKFEFNFKVPILHGGWYGNTFIEIHNKQKSQNAKQDERYKTRAALTKLQELKELRRKLPGD